MYVMFVNEGEIVQKAADNVCNMYVKGFCCVVHRTKSYGVKASSGTLGMLISNSVQFSCHERDNIRRMCMSLDNIHVHDAVYLYCLAILFFYPWWWSLQ